MSTIRHSTSTTTHTSQGTARRTTKSAATNTTAAAATRATVDPPKLEVRTLTKELGLTEAQRDRVRPVLAGEERKMSQANHMKWSSASARRGTLWQIRDDTARDLRRMVDVKQQGKLTPLLGPAK